MSGTRLELPTPDGYASAQEYVEQHLAPVATELHRLVNELLMPGSTSAEEWESDMIPSGPFTGGFQPLVEHLKPAAKHVTFDGSAYFSLPKEHLRAKRAKVQFTAVVYGKRLHKQLGSVAFRLIRADGMVIDNSEFQVTTEEPETVSRILPFGAMDGSVSPERHDYIIEGRYLGARMLPVCRRLSLSFVYI